MPGGRRPSRAFTIRTATGGPWRVAGTESSRQSRGSKAEKAFLDGLSSAKVKGRRDRVVFLTDLVTGTERGLIRRWLAALGSTQHVMYEPFAYEALRKANQTVFGADAIPAYHIDKADFLLSFGANFLETWVSNVQFTRQFASFHEPKGEKKNVFVYVGPRLSMTAANADQWIMVPPGGESLVALGLLRLLLEQGQGAWVKGQVDKNPALCYGG